MKNFVLSNISGDVPCFWDIECFTFSDTSIVLSLLLWYQEWHLCRLVSL